MYIEHLQKRTVETKQTYYEIRNRLRTVVRQMHWTNWEACISRTKHELHGLQEIAFKLMKNLNWNEENIAWMSVMPKVECITHYKNLWFGLQEEPWKMESRDKVTVDRLELVELHFPWIRGGTGKLWLRSYLLWSQIWNRFRLLRLYHKYWIASNTPVL